MFFRPYAPIKAAARPLCGLALYRMHDAFFTDLPTLMVQTNEAEEDEEATKMDDLAHNTLFLHSGSCNRYCEIHLRLVPLPHELVASCVRNATSCSWRVVRSEEFACIETTERVLHDLLDVVTDEAAHKRIKELIQSLFSIPVVQACHRAHSFLRRRRGLFCLDCVNGCRFVDLRSEQPASRCQPQIRHGVRHGVAQEA